MPLANDMIAFLRAHGPFSLVASLVLGIGARGVMRIVALQAGLRPGLSVGGSLEVIVFVALVGLPLALLFFLVRPRLRIPSPVAGVLLGILTFAAFALWPPPAARSALAGTPDSPAVTAALFAALLVGFGVVLDWRWERRRRRLTPMPEMMSR